MHFIATGSCNVAFSNSFVTTRIRMRIQLLCAWQSVSVTVWPDRVTTICSRVEVTVCSARQHVCVTTRHGVYSCLRPGRMFTNLRLSETVKIPNRDCPLGSDAHSSVNVIFLILGIGACHLEMPLWNTPKSSTLPNNDILDKKSWKGVKWDQPKRWRADLDKYWRDTIWYRTAQDRLTWRWHAETGYPMMMMNDITWNSPYIIENRITGICRQLSHFFNKLLTSWRVHVLAVPCVHEITRAAHVHA